MTKSRKLGRETDLLNGWSDNRTVPTSRTRHTAGGFLLSGNGTRRFGKALIAFFLGIAMLVGLGAGFAPSAAAAPSAPTSSLVLPTQVQEAEKPDVWIETNIVLNTQKKPTQYVELVLKARTPVIYFADNEMTQLRYPGDGLENQAGRWSGIAFDATDPKTYAVSRQTTFREIGASFQYNTNLLVPVSWEHEIEWDETGKIVQNAYPDFYAKYYVDESSLMKPGPDGNLGTTDDVPMEGEERSAEIRRQFADDKNLQRIAVPTLQYSTESVSSAVSYAGGSSGLISMAVNSNADTVLPQESALAVVRFLYIGEEPIEHLLDKSSDPKIGYTVNSNKVSSWHNTQNGGSTKPDGTELNDFFWFADDTLIKQSTVQQALIYTSGRYQENLSVESDRIGGINQFYATKLIYNGGEVPADQLPDYTMATISYDKHPTDTNKQNYTVETPEGMTSPIHRPKTDEDNITVLATARKDGDKLYSYTSNLLFTTDRGAELVDGSNENIAFTLRAGPTYKSTGGGTVDDFAAVVFIDWDDTMLGALVVPKGDARDRVEEYVEKFIHPTLRKSTAMAMDDGAAKTERLFNLSRSLDRKYTYAGSHTSDYATLSAFAGMSYSEAEAAMSTNDTYLGKTIFPDGYTVDDVDMAGSSYPLTNKLDYAFLRRPVLGSETITADTEGSPYVDADGKTVDAVEWNLGAVDYDGTQTPETVDDNYWYTSGWAVVRKPAEVSNVWTTFSTTGELSEAKLPAFDSTTVTAGGHEYDGMSYFNADYIRATGDATPDANMPAGTAVAATANAAGNGEMAFATYADSAYFEFADFADVKVDELFVKACYEPCEQLSWTGYYSVISTEPYYVRYGTAASTEDGSVYSVSFEYERINTAGVGVRRIRDLWAKVQYTVDIGETAEPDEYNSITYDGSSFFVGTQQSSTDSIPINFTPTSTFLSMKYGVGEVYGRSNFVESIDRSTFGNELNVIDNFKYLRDTNNPESWENGYRYDNRLGTYGYVYRATLRQIEEEATKVFSGQAATDETEFRNTYLSTGTMLDLNLRLDKEGTTGDGAGLGVADRNRKILNAQRAIYDALRIAYKYNSVGEDGVIDIDWHQLQYHILNWETNGGIDAGTRIRTKEECGQYQWCRLDACGESISIPVTNFAELYDAIGIMNDSSATQARRDAAKKAIDENALGIINAPNLKIFKTNKSSDGSVEYKTLDDLKANGMYVQSDIDTAGQTGLIGALKALRDSVTDPSALSEKQLQKWLMTYAQNPATASYNFDEDGQDRYDYWWFYWDTKPEAVDFDSITPDTTLELLVKTAYAHHNDNPLAWDGFKAEHMEKTRLRASERGDFYDAAAQGAFAGGAIEFEWRADADRVLTPLTDVDAFIATMTELIANAATDNGANEEWASENDTINKIAATNSWEQLQYYLLHGETTAHPEYYAGTENGQYWWKDESAGTRLTKTATSIDTSIVPPISRPTNATMDDLRTKLETYAGEIGAAKEAAAEKFRIWFTQETAVDLVLKRTERGGNITTANTEAIATALLEFATQHKNSGRAFSDISWSQVQHYILNGTYTSTKGAQSFTHGTRCTWGENAWREPKIESITELARLIEIIDSAAAAADIESWIESFEDLTIPNLYFKVDSDKLAFGGTSAGAALMQLKTDYAATGGVWAELALTDNIDSAWYLIQYYLYHGSLVTSGTNVLEDTATAGKLEYWWKDGWEGISTWQNFYDLVRGDVPARVDWLEKQSDWDSVTYMCDLRATSWAEVISTVKQLDVANLSQDNLWYNLQFAAIHKQIAPTSQLAVDEGTNFYWWYDLGSATSVRLPALPDEANEYANDISQLNSVASAIAENKLRETATGNAVAGALVTAANVSAMHIRVPDDSSATRAEMTAYDDATISIKLEGLIKHVYETSVADGVAGWDYVTDDGVFTYNEAAMNAVKAITVYDIQHWLVEGKYPAPSDAATTYWWIEKDVKPGGKTLLDELKEVYIAIFAYGSAGKAKDVPTSIVDGDMWSGKFGFTNGTLTQVLGRLTATKANTFIGYGTYHWAQMQVFYGRTAALTKPASADAALAKLNGAAPPAGLEEKFTITTEEINAFKAANGL